VNMRAVTIAYAALIGGGLVYFCVLALAHR
jgi:hypothetical protein